MIKKFKRAPTHQTDNNGSGGDQGRLWRRGQKLHLNAAQIVERKIAPVLHLCESEYLSITSGGSSLYLLKTWTKTYKLLFW